MPRPKPFVRTTTKTTAKTTKRTTTTRRPNTTKRPTLQEIFGNGGGGKNSNSNRFQPSRPNTTAKTTPRLRPTRRPIFTGQRTTTELSIQPSRRPKGGLFQCDFQTKSKECEVKFSGKEWQSFTSATDKFYEIILDGGQRSEIFFSQMVPPPSGGIACLSFRYRKFLDSKFPPSEI